jgi:prevent-host-death family protein
MIRIGTIGVHLPVLTSQSSLSVMPDGTPGLPPTWKLQDAKARFSELVRAARAHGPQTVTVHGRDAVVVLSAEEYARLTPRVALSPPLHPSGRPMTLLEVMQACPDPDFEFDFPSVPVVHREPEF